MNTLLFPERTTQRLIFPPAKHSIYWDASIPMEYYEQEFLDFEDYAVMVGKTIQSSAQNPSANSDFMLHNSAKYEKFWKKESRKEWKKCVAKQNKALKRHRSRNRSLMLTSVMQPLQSKCR